MLTPSSKPRRNWKPAIEGILFTLAWLTLTNITIYFIYVRAVEAVKEQIREGLLRNVSAAATMIDGDQHKLFTSKAFKNDQGYVNLITRLERVRKASSDVKYAYTNIIKGDKVYFIANGSPQGDNDKDGRPDEAPQLMDPYPDAGLALRDALRFQKPAVDKEPYTDAWGTFYSAYAPFKDSRGKFVGTLGMDLELVTLKARLVPIGVAAQRAALTSDILAILFGAAVWFFRSRNRILEEQRGLAIGEKSKVELERIQERSSSAIQLEAIATKMENKTKNYASALIRYARARQGIRSSSAENFDPAVLIKSALPPDISIQVSSELPTLIWGDSKELDLIIKSLCYNAITSTILPSLDEIKLSVKNEQLNNIGLAVNIRYCDPTSAQESRAVLIADRDHPEHVFDENSLQFATCVELVRALGGTLSHEQITENVEVVSLILPFNKFKEV
ncbi:hypothetical protein [Synechococcus sp. UW140]|uniref:hypothetical protein n=1 Tax=Synechococcus sp. UW140 TaxID=368503 RepID=UPI003137E55F